MQSPPLRHAAPHALRAGAGLSNSVYTTYITSNFAVLSSIDYFGFDKSYDNLIDQVRSTKRSDDLYNRLILVHPTRLFFSDSSPHTAAKAKSRPPPQSSRVWCSRPVCMGYGTPGGPSLPLLRWTQTKHTCPNTLQNEWKGLILYVSSPYNHVLIHGTTCDDIHMKNWRDVEVINMSNEKLTGLSSSKLFLSIGVATCDCRFPGGHGEPIQVVFYVSRSLFTRLYALSCTKLHIHIHKH